MKCPHCKIKYEVEAEEYIESLGALYITIKHDAIDEILADILTNMDNVEIIEEGDNRRYELLYLDAVNLLGFPPVVVCLICHNQLVPDTGIKEVSD